MTKVAPKKKKKKKKYVVEVLRNVSSLPLLEASSRS